MEDYRWSSYPAFIGLREPEDWLERELTYQLVKHFNPFEDYRDYVKRGVDEDTKQFHEKDNMAAIFGDAMFKQWVLDELMPQLAAEQKSCVIQLNLSMPIVVPGVAAYYNTTSEALLKCTREPQHDNEPRKVAMYLSQELSATRLVEIADYFNLNHYGSVSFTTHQTRQRKSADRQFDRKLNELIKGLIKSNR